MAISNKIEPVDTTLVTQSLQKVAKNKDELSLFPLFINALSFNLNYSMGLKTIQRA